MQLNKRFKSIDELQIVDTSKSIKANVLALFKNGEVDSAVHHGKLPEWFEHGLPKLFKKIETRDNNDLFKKLEIS